MLIVGLIYGASCQLETFSGPLGEHLEHFGALDGLIMAPSKLTGDLLGSPWRTSGGILGPLWSLDDSSLAHSGPLRAGLEDVWETLGPLIASGRYLAARICKSDERVAQNEGGCSHGVFQDLLVGGKGVY